MDDRGANKNYAMEGVKPSAFFVRHLVSTMEAIRSVVVHSAVVRSVIVRPVIVY